MIDFLGYAIACVVSVVATLFLVSRRTVGTLCFYAQEPPEPPAMIASLDKPVEEFHKYGYVVFRVSRR